MKVSNAASAAGNRLLSDYSTEALFYENVHRLFLSFLQAKHPAGISQRRGLHFFPRNALDSGYRFRHIAQISRGIPAAPVRLRCQIRTVRLQNQIIERDILNDLFKFAGILISQHPADAEALGVEKLVD